MCKRHMAMSEWEVLSLVQLLQSNDEMISWNINPAALRHQCRASGFKFTVWEDALAECGGWGALDVDFVAGGDQGAGCGGGEGGSKE